MPLLTKHDRGFSFPWIPSDTLILDATRDLVAERSVGSVMLSKTTEGINRSKGLSNLVQIGLEHVSNLH